MDKKSYLFASFILVACLILPVLVYSCKNNTSVKRKRSDENASSVGTVVKKDCKNPQEKLVKGKSSSTTVKPKSRTVNVSNKTAIKRKQSERNASSVGTVAKKEAKKHREEPVKGKSSRTTTAKPKSLRANVNNKTAKAQAISPNKKLVRKRPIVVDLPVPATDEKVNSKLGEKEDDVLLLGNEELHDFYKLADSDTIPPGNLVVPRKDKKMSIVPIAIAKEEVDPFKFLHLPSYIPDIIKVLPIKFDDIETVKPISFMRPEISATQGYLEPEWFKPKKLKPNVNYEKDGSLVEQLEELAPDYLDHQLDTVYWPKFLGPRPSFRPYRRKSKKRRPTKVTPVIINTPKDARDKVITVTHNLTLGAMCRFSSECKSRCCLRLRTKKRKPQLCHRRSRKGQPCGIGQLKIDVYYGICPCFAGDSHCKSVANTGSKATCDA